MAASGDCELGGDHRENEPDFVAEPDQDRDCNHGDKGQDQGIFNESLTSFAFSVAARIFLSIQPGYRTLFSITVCPAADENGVVPGLTWPVLIPW